MIHSDFENDINDYIKLIKRQIENAMHLGIRNHNLYYVPKTLNRITKEHYREGDVVMRIFLDHQTENEVILVEVRWFCGVEIKMFDGFELKSDTLGFEVFVSGGKKYVSMD